MKKISVVIPTYNRAKYIKESIISVLDQEGEGEFFSVLEVLVIDDCSSDETPKVVNSVNDSRVKYHRMEHNSGPATARNTGVDIACGEWIAFQDSDDKWHRDKLKKQTAYLKSHPGTKMVSHPIRAKFDDGSEVITKVIESEDTVSCLAQMNYFDTPTILVNKVAFLEMGSFDPYMKALEDWEFALRFADKYKIGMVPEVLIDSVMISGGVSSNAADYYESRCRMIAKNRDVLLRYACFDDAVKSLFIHAKNNGVLDKVGKILELNLSAL